MKLTSRIAAATILTCAVLGIGAIFVHVNSVMYMLNMQNNDRGISMAYALVSKIEAQQNNNALNKITFEYTNTYLYPKIILFNSHGDVFFESQDAKVKKIAPTWFTKIFVEYKINPITVAANHWKSISNVEIIFNKEAISAIVWSSTRAFVFYYIGFLVIVLFVQYVVMSNFREIVKAAKMVNRRNFNIHKIHSSAPDLLELVNLINYLPSKIHKVVQGHVALNNLLKMRIVLNNTSQLHNKCFFAAQFQHLLDSSQAAHGGCLIYFLVNHAKVSHEQVSQLLIDLTKKYNIVLSAHLDDDVFALVLLNSPAVLLDKIIIDLQTKLYAKNIGIVKFSHNSYKDEVCTRAYNALNQSKNAYNGLYVDEENITVASVINNWQEFISKTIYQKSLLLSYQPVYLYQRILLVCIMKL
jgi:hypothetical protein